MKGVSSIAKRYLNTKTEPLYVCDGSAFIYRGFYAYSTMQRLDGFPTSAIYIVMRLILKVLQQEKPKYFAFIIDGKGTNFRSQLYEEYKKTRDKTPEALVRQLPVIEQLLCALGIPVFVTENAEADDYIAGLAERYATDGVVILGVDKDLRQCLTPDVLLWDPSAKEERVITYESFIAETGMHPSQWADYQAIVGDSADNIPGVLGIGPKTAQKIFLQVRDLESLRDALPQFEKKIQEKITPVMDILFTYRELTRLHASLCPTITKEELLCSHPMPDIVPLLQEYELHSIEKELKRMTWLWSGTPLERIFMQETTPTKTKHIVVSDSDVGTTPEQQSLFSVQKESVQQGIAHLQGDHSTTHNGESTHIPSISEDTMPDCTDKVVVLYLHEGVCYFCCDDVVYRVPKDISLFSLLSRARCCYTAEYKNILRYDASLLQFPISSVEDISLIAYLVNPQERAYTLETLQAIWNTQLPQQTNTLHEFLLQAVPYMVDILRATGMFSLYSTIEKPLIHILATMEHKGMKVDQEELSLFLEETKTILDQEEQAIYLAAGYKFNIRSPQQLGKVLFEELGLPHAAKTKTGQYSTSQEILENLKGEHTIVTSLLQYRMFEKLRSTYLEPLLALAKKEERIHTTFNQFSTATGRLSSSNPNLQNIPIRGPLGTRMRSIFCAQEGMSLIAMDYSQIELRVLAYLSNEPTLLEAFYNNEDIHKKTASLLYAIPQSEVTKEQRNNAKIINFGLLYGMGAQKLARELGITVIQARDFITVYFEKLSAVREFYNTVEEQAKEHGYVTTLFGRRRSLPEIYSKNMQLYAQARRQAINTVVQGTAADIIKYAMVRIAANQYYAAHNASVLLQVHDELIVEVPTQYANAVAKEMERDMSTVDIDGKQYFFAVSWGIGRTWNDAH